MTNEDIYKVQMKLAAEAAFRIISGVKPTDEDLNILEQQHHQAWQLQIEDEEKCQ